MTEKNTREKIWRYLAEKMRSHFPQSGRRLISRIADFLNDGQQFPSLKGTLSYMHRWGWSPCRVIDVGAYNGEWTKSFRERFPAARVLMIEPLEKQARKLSDLADRSDGMIEYVEALLGCENGKTVRFVAMETGSSIFEEASPFAREYRMMQTTTLDTILQQKSHFLPVDLLKIDVQGYELEVLKGFQGGLKQTEFVLLEASLIPVNHGCPLIHEVIGYMNEAGFSLFDICSMIRRTDGSLWQTDLMFINRTSRFMPMSSLTKDNWPCA